jgi:hypothetical protein
VWSVAFSPDGHRIASGSVDHTVRLWDADTRQPVGKPIIPKTIFVDSVAFSPDGKRIASGSWDKAIRLWDTDTGQPIGDPMTGHTMPVWSVAFSPDGKRIASASRDKTIRLWDADTDQRVSEITGHSDMVTSVAFRPDGKRIVSGSVDGTVRLWNAETGQPVGHPMTPPGAQYAVYSVAFSPNGKRIASGSYDNTVRLWDAHTGQPVGHPMTAPAAVRGNQGGVQSRRRAHCLRRRQHSAAVARLPRRHVGVMRQAHHQYEPSAVAGLGLAAHRLHHCLPGAPRNGRLSNCLQFYKPFEWGSARQYADEIQIHYKLCWFCANPCSRNRTWTRRPVGMDGQIHNRGTMTCTEVDGVPR